MENWVRVCGLAEAPAEGQVAEAEVNGVQVCLARFGGRLSAVDNLCPHRQGPMGQGWLEGGAVVCPWHSWAFSLETGEADYPVGERIRIFGLKVEDDAVLVDLGLA